MELFSAPQPNPPRIYDRHGIPIGMERFVELWADPAYRTVSSDRIGRFRIETIWLGIDHGPAERRALFETAVHELAEPLDFRLLSTLAEARTCHRQALAALVGRAAPLLWSPNASSSFRMPDIARADF